MEKAILLSKEHPDYFGFKWTLKAIFKYKIPSPIHLLNIQDGDIVATDGHRLHNYFLTQSFENGLYYPFCAVNKIILIQSSETGYPEWKNLFLDTPAQKEIEVPATTDPKALNKSYAKLIRLMKKTEAFDLSYWNDILSFGGKYKVQWYGIYQQVIFIASTHRAVVMPVRL